MATRRWADPRLSNRTTNWMSAAVSRLRVSARIMAPPPSSDSQLLLFNLAAFGRDLGRATSSGEALDLLQASAGTTGTPQERLAGWRQGPATGMVARWRPAGTAAA